MIVQLVIVAVIVAVTIGVAIASRRVGGDAAPTPSGFTVPGRVARNDFEHPERPWLVAVFTSETCDSCAGVVERAAPLDSPEVAVAAVPVQDQAETHAKYRIDGVPTTIIADAHGTVVGSFLGPVQTCLLYTSPSPRDRTRYRMPSSA